ncbi:MAG: hydrogenase maturation protease [Phormidesmis sp.]
MTYLTALKPIDKPVHKSRFLIIGYGNELRGDDAVGPIAADVVASWNLPETKAMSVHQLTEDLASHVAATDYVIFISACSGSSCARTVQLDPVVEGTQMFEALAVKDIHSCNPLSLLYLAQQIYGRKPQAWFLQIPIESFDCEEGLSSITQRGCDQAVRTVEKFMRTYRQPVWMNSRKFTNAA